MSVCSFLSDESLEHCEHQSFLEMSLDTSAIEVKERLGAKDNLKKLQAMLFQTNFYLQKLEEKMNETQRKLDVEVCIRQLRSHQTVLGLKINAEVIDDSFMSFVAEKQKKLLEEVKKVLEFKHDLLSNSDINATGGCDTTSMSSPQVTPAFSAQKTFTFKDLDCMDIEVSCKLNQVFYNFFAHKTEQEAIESLYQGTFSQNFPKITENLEKAIKSISTYKSLALGKNLNTVQIKCRENLKQIETQAKSLNLKSSALKELHLNLANIDKRQGKTSSCTQTCEASLDSEEQQLRVQDLQEQLSFLNMKFEEIYEENAEIKKYQSELVRKMKGNKNSDKENSEFFKERFENSKALLSNLQENYKRVLKENELLKDDLRKKIEGNTVMLSKVNSVRYDLSGVIKDLEKNRKKLGVDMVDSAITALHQISLRLIQKDTICVVPPGKTTARPQARSKSSLKTASEQLDFYILQNH